MYYGVVVFTVLYKYVARWTLGLGCRIAVGFTLNTYLVFTDFTGTTRLTTHAIPTLKVGTLPGLQSVSVN